MDQAANSLQGVKQIFCSKHNFQSLDQIDLTGNTTSGRLCLLCIKKNKIPYDQYLSISELFAYKEGEILSCFPPFKNEQIRDTISTYCQQNINISDVDLFFHKLREDIESAIQEAEKRGKQQLIKNQFAQQILLEELYKIGEIDKLKELLISGSEKINEFLKDKWENAEQNEKDMQNCFNQIIGSTEILNFEKNQKEVNCLIESLKVLSLFDLIENKNNIINEVNLIKSTYETSLNLTIKKTVQNSLQLINTTLQDQYGQAYLDFILDPKKKYIIRVNYQPTQQNSTFYFGIVQDQSKENGWCSNKKLSYYNKSGFGIDKLIKGPTTFYRRYQKESFEVRICQSEKILKMSTLPNYESVLELDDPNKISPETQYRFFIIIFYSGDQIEITDIIESDSFENYLF